METQHPEDDNISPFVVQVKNAATVVGDIVDQRHPSGEPENEDFVSCPVEDCGEQILLVDIEGHVEMHGEEGAFSSSASPEIEEQMGSSNMAQKPATRRMGVKLDIEYGNEDFDENMEDSKDQRSGFGTKLAHALRNLEDVDLEVHERKERSGRNGQRKGHVGGQSAKSAWGKILKMPDTSDRKGGTRRRSRSPARNSVASPKKGGVKRLGVCTACWEVSFTLLTSPQRAELGPHANEKQMPDWLVKLLQDNDGKLVTINQLDKDGRTRRSQACPNMAADIVPVIAQLSDMDPNVAYAYVCNSAVKHVSKLTKEG